MTATIYNGRGAPDAARTVSFALPAGDYSGLALTLDFLCNRIPAEIDGDGCCFATIPEEALRTIPCGTHRAALLLRGSNGQEAVFASVPIRVSDIPGEASAYADVESVTPSFAPANAVTADALAEALAAIDAPGTGATQMTLRETLAALVTALKTISSAVAGFCLFSLAAAGESIPWEQVPPDTPVDPAALLPVTESDPTVHDWAKAANPPRETDPAFTEWARTNTYVKAETEPAFSEWVAGSTNEFGDVRSAAEAADLSMPRSFYVRGGPSDGPYEFSVFRRFLGRTFMVPEDYATASVQEVFRLPVFVLKAGVNQWRLARADLDSETFVVSDTFSVDSFIDDITVNFDGETWLIQPAVSAVARMSDVAAATNNLAPPDLSGYSPTGHVHAASDITSGTLDAARIPNLAASKITSGSFADARIPNLAATKITSGTLADARIPANIARTNAVAAVALSSTNYTDSAVATRATPEAVTNIVHDLSLGGIWDEQIQVWWTPRMRNGSLTYEATTNVNLNAED